MVLSLGSVRTRVYFLFFFNDTATTEISPLSLHDALPIWRARQLVQAPGAGAGLPRSPGRTARACGAFARSEEHTSELQSHLNLVCRLLLEKKKTSARPPPPWRTRRRTFCALQTAN